MFCVCVCARCTKLTFPFPKFVLIVAFSSSSSSIFHSFMRFFFLLFIFCCWFYFRWFCCCWWWCLFVFTDNSYHSHFTDLSLQQQHKRRVEKQEIQMFCCVYKYNINKKSYNNNNRFFKSVRNNWINEKFRKDNRVRNGIKNIWHINKEIMVILLKRAKLLLTIVYYFQDDHRLRITNNTKKTVTIIWKDSAEKIERGREIESSIYKNERRRKKEE